MNPRIYLFTTQALFNSIGDAIFSDSDSSIFQHVLLPRGRILPGKTYGLPRGTGQRRSYDLGDDLSKSRTTTKTRDDAESDLIVTGFRPGSGFVIFLDPWLRTGGIKGSILNSLKVRLSFDNVEIKGPVRHLGPTLVASAHVLDELNPRLKPTDSPFETAGEVLFDLLTGNESPYFLRASVSLSGLSMP